MKTASAGCKRAIVLCRQRILIRTIHQIYPMFFLSFCSENKNREREGENHRGKFSRCLKLKQQIYHEIEKFQAVGKVLKNY